MIIKVVESSLNLRIERGKTKEDYILSKSIADQQLSFEETDIYANVEFMDCNNDDYLKAFEAAGYKSYLSLDAKGRGILCEIKADYKVEKIAEMSEPHMLHLHIQKEDVFMDLITVRILVAGGNEADFKDRKRQWDKIINYIETLSDQSHLVLTGDFNHGVINDDINGYRFKPRQFFNYQMIVSDLGKRNITLFPMEGTSYRGYMKIDHIAAGENITIDTAVYNDLFSGTEGIGIPDHSCIVASLQCE